MRRFVSALDFQRLSSAIAVARGLPMVDGAQMLVSACGDSRMLRLSSDESAPLSIAFNLFTDAAFRAWETSDATAAGLDIFATIAKARRAWYRRSLPDILFEEATPILRDSALNLSPLWAESLPSRLDPGSSVAYGDGHVIVRLFEDPERNLAANIGLAAEVGATWPAWPVATPVWSNQGVNEVEFRARIRSLAQWIRDHWSTLRVVPRRGRPEESRDAAVFANRVDRAYVYARLPGAMAKLQAPAANDFFFAKDCELLRISSPRASAASIEISEGIETQFRAYGDSPTIRRALNEFLGRLDEYGSRGPFPEVEEKIVADVSDILARSPVLLSPAWTEHTARGGDAAASAVFRRDDLSLRFRRTFSPVHGFSFEAFLGADSAAASVTRLALPGDLAPRKRPTGPYTLTARPLAAWIFDNWMSLERTLRANLAN